MDIESLKNMNNTLTNHLKSTRKDLNNFNKIQNNTSNKEQKSGIVVARKGDSGYIRQMDLDEDGEISLEEFNQYCEENGVSQEEKLRMLNTMQTAKTNSKLMAKATEVKKQGNGDANKSSEIDNKSIYARKGDDNYNEEMDTNKNDIVTYQEYMEYCNKHSEKSESNTSESKETQTYTQNEHYNEEPEYSVDTEA